MSQPLISCLMVTKDRASLAERAICCLAEQTWSNKELVIIDDGDEDYTPVIDKFRERVPIHYHRITPEPGVYLGGLRNLSLDRANGEFAAQWDDDEWYHPERLERQMAAIDEQGLDAVVLQWTLMHVDTPQLAAHPYRADVGSGTPGTILHRRTDVRYPNQRRAEDSVFLQDLSRTMKVGIVTGEHSHLFIRCYHGENTWEEQHFHRRLRRTPWQFLQLLKARYIKRDIFTHPAFVLTEVERDAIERFYAESRELGLLAN